MYAYLKFGLPRVLPPGGPGKGGFKDTASEIHALDSVSARNQGGVMRARSETDLVNGGGQGHSGHNNHNGGPHPMGLISNRFRKPKSESNLLNGGGGGDHLLHPVRPMSKAGSQVSCIYIY